MAFEEQRRSARSELTPALQAMPSPPKPRFSFESVSHDVLTMVVVVVALAGYFAYRHYTEARKNREHAARTAEFESRISRFVAPYDAVRDWQRPLPTKGRSEKVYSAELAPLLIRQDGRPIFLFANLRNVNTSDGRSVIYFDEATALESQLKLRLDCTPDQARLVMSHPASDYSYAVIAQIQSLDYILTGDYSLATGRCVDILHLSVGDYLEFVLGPEIEKLPASLR